MRLLKAVELRALTLEVDVKALKPITVDEKNVDLARAIV